MDAVPVQNAEDRRTLFYNHLKELRREPWLRNAFVVLFVENNTGFEAGEFADVLRGFNKHAAYVEPQSESHRRKMTSHSRTSANDSARDLTADYLRRADFEPGYTQTHKKKHQHRTDLRNALLQDRIFYYCNGISGDIVSKQNLTRLQRFAQNKEKLEEQLGRCRVFVRESNYDTAPERVFWSGKVNAEGKKQGGFNDDLVMTLAAGVSMWEQAMNGELAGFPYDKVGMIGVRAPYHAV